ADRNRNHWSTSKTPSYTKSVSWQHHRFLRKDIKKDKITDREMEIIRMTAQGMQPKSIARIENCSVKTVYTHRRNAEAKLYSKIYKLVQ
ncbi:helix-turn-helix transcriptional regulator, partial [Escherichia coli]|uniref:helix-turn-helix transcriptional regulator n=1 Tax=Escherichia coli TaxID=562 RepID=UPI001FCED76A